MKVFERKNRYFSLCGLNCALCPMYVGGYCPSCGGGEGNQSCRIAKCSLEQGGIEFCFDCKKYPCEHYGERDDFDSFITYRNRRADAERSKKDIRSYVREQEEKEKILLWLLSECNDGRRKTLFCTAVNLLPLQELENVMQVLREHKTESQKEKAVLAAALLQEEAKKQGISLSLRKNTERR